MSSPELSLFRRFPDLRERVPHLPLGRFPTPLEPLRLPGASADLWIKRDDLSAAPYGGNKVRKLEFLLGAAEARRSGSVITAGAVGSHHALATAVYARARGLPVTLCLAPQPLTAHVREVLLLDLALGARLVFVPHLALIPPALLAQRLRRREERPFVVAPGGSSLLGSLGYVSAALEVARQIREGEAPVPHRVQVPCGTMGTAAGLAVGFALAGLRVRVRAVRVVPRLVAGEVRLRRLVAGVLRFLRERGVATPRARTVHGLLEMDHDQVGRGYGHPTPQAARAVERFRGSGVELDGTYTAKAAAAFLAAADREPDRTHLFWHTLGALPGEEIVPRSDPEDLPSRFRRLLGAGRPGG